MNANFAALTAATDKLRAELHAQGESIRSEISRRFNTLLIAGTTVSVALFTAMVGGFIAIFLRLWARAPLLPKRPSFPRKREPTWAREVHCDVARFASFVNGLCDDVRFRETVANVAGQIGERLRAEQGEQVVPGQDARQRKPQLLGDEGDVLASLFLRREAP